MALTIDQFWALAVQSRVISAGDAQRHAANLSQFTTAGGVTAVTLAQWLVTQGVLSKYQAKVLLAGRAGPFVFGDYRIHDRLDSAGGVQMFLAKHLATGRPVRFCHLPSELTTELRDRLAARLEAVASTDSLAKAAQCGHLVVIGSHQFAVLDDADPESPQIRTFEQWLDERAAPVVAVAPRDEHRVTDEMPRLVAGRRSMRSRGRHWPLAAGGVAVIGFAVAAMVYMTTGQGDRTSSEPPQAAITSTQPPKAAVESDAKVPGDEPKTNPPDQRNEAIVALDRPLWQSPTSGAPLSLAYLPLGVQAIVSLRPAEIIQHTEGKKLLDPRTMGLLSTWLTDGLPKRAGTTLENMEQVTLGWYQNEQGGLEYSLVIHLRQPLEAGELSKAWGAPKRVEETSFTMFERDGLRCLLPQAEHGRTIVVGPGTTIAEIAASGGAPPPLRREMEDLLAASDDRRLFTLLVAPEFLLSTKSFETSGTTDALAVPLRWMICGQEPRSGEAETHTAAPRQAVEMTGLDLPKAMLASLHLDEDLFAELRISVTPGTSPADTAAGLRDRLEQLSQRVDRYVAQLHLSEYSHDVLWNLPKMAAFVPRYATVGFMGRQVVVRAYLPSNAAHNLALGTHLALLEPRRTSDAVAASPAGPATIEERLKQKASLAFANNSLEKALSLFGEEIGVEVIILGPDLQLEGITRNQSIKDLDERDRPAGEILRKIMLKANPDGKLVYVAKSKPDRSGDALFITTRAAAQGRGDKLPAELAQ